MLISDKQQLFIKRTILSLMLLILYCGSLRASELNVGQEIGALPVSPEPPRFNASSFLPTDFTDIPSQVVAADFNLDGKIDLAVKTRYNVQIFLGKGNGSFLPFRKYSLKDRNSAIAVGDLNNDGIPDLIVTNSVPGCAYCQIRILLGNGDGRFHAGAAISVGDQINGIAIADLNGDGNFDLVLAMAHAEHLRGRVGVLLGQGDGTFGDLSTYFVNSAANSVVVDDFNRDGVPDIVCANGYGLHILYGNGDGTFQSPVALSQTPGEQVGTADFNGDGLPDLVTQNKTGVTVLLNEGGGQFRPRVSKSAGILGNFALCDFNGDGIIDLVMADSRNGLGIMFGNGDGTFRAPTSFYADSSGGNLIALDLNGDHKMDVVQVSVGILGNQSGLRLLFGNGGGGLHAPHEFPTGGYDALITTGDFNNDGKIDVATFDFNNRFVGTCSVVLGNGNGTFGAPLTLPISTGVAIAAGDFNGDGKLDLIVLGGSQSGDLLFLGLGNGDGTFQPIRNVGSGLFQTVAMTLADFNHDGKLDIAVAGSQGISVLLGNGDGSFQQPVIYSVNLPNSLVSADFNGDGIPDLAVAGSSSVDVLINNGDGTFGPATAISDSGGISIVAADFNGDGAQDLAFVSNSIVVMLGAGNGSFGSPIVTLSAVSGLAVADFNGDGIVDIAGFRLGEVSVLSGVGDGTFTSAANLEDLAPSSIAPAVLGNNVLPDLLVGTTQGTSLAVVLNSGS